VWSREINGKRCPVAAATLTACHHKPERDETAGVKALFDGIGIIPPAGEK